MRQASRNTKTKPSGEAGGIRLRNADLTKMKLLEAARRHFAAMGMEARVDEIAAEAGANKRMAYYYFGSKEGLYLAALEATYLELVEAEKQIDVDRLAPLEAINALVSTKFDYYVKHPDYVEFLKIENLYRARHLQTSERIDELKAPLAKTLTKVIARGQSDGSIRKDINSMDLYITISGLGFFIFSNRHTLGAIFGLDLTKKGALAHRKAVIADVVQRYVRA